MKEYEISNKCLTIKRDEAARTNLYYALRVFAGAISLLSNK